MSAGAASEDGSLASCLKSLASFLGFSERRPGLFVLELGEDITAYIDFRGSWKGWRYAFRGGGALTREEIESIEPLRRFKEIRDGIIHMLEGPANPGVVAPVVHVNGAVEYLRSVRMLKTKLLDENDYIYLDAEGNPTVRSKAAYRRIKKAGWRKLASAFGLCFLILGKERQTCRDEKGEYYIWTYRVKVIDPKSGRFAEAEGSCSSRDSLLQSKGEVNESDVIHKAQSAAVSRGIADLLGLEAVEAVKEGAR